MTRSLRTIPLLAAAGFLLFACEAHQRAYESGQSEPAAGFALPHRIGAGGWDDLAASDSMAGLPAFRPGTDEIWVFQEGAQARNPSDGDGPTSGSMFTRDGETVVPVPLKHTDVKASIRSYLATVDVTQQFHNPYASKIEAVYVFPLPDDAAVRDFVMVIGDRQIRGMVRSKEEAQQIYLQARAAGHRAALLEQHRPNVFEQRVANIEPGKAIDVRIRYFHCLPLASDGYEFVFPMVVGERYEPAGGQNLGVRAPNLAQGMRPGTDVSVAVDVEAGLPLVDVKSPSHAIDVVRTGETGARVSLRNGATIPNRDFVLRLGVLDARASAAMLTHEDEQGGWFTMLVQPPNELASLPRQPMEMVFVLDCSGSMSGTPLMQAKATVRMALDKMTPQDSFQIVRFSDAASTLSEMPLPATPENVARARRHLDELRSEGGTQMSSGILAALRAPHDREKLRFVAFLTDGFIGNENEIFDLVDRELGDNRVFALGVGSSVNRFLLEGLAQRGHGAVGYLLHDEEPGRAVAQLLERITHPAMVDVAIDWGGANVTDVYPAKMPDLFVGRPIAVVGRYRGEAPAAVQLRGRLGGLRVSLPVAQRTERAARDEGLAALPAIWARQKIRDLVDFASPVAQANGAAEAKSLALQFGLVSQWTSMLAVDASERTAGTTGTTVQVPVPMPAGVQYATGR